MGMGYYLTNPINFFDQSALDLLGCNQQLEGLEAEDYQIQNLGCSH